MQAAGHGLKRELKLPDLVLMQILLVVAFPWIGFVAKGGPSQEALWLPAIVLFYLPLAAVVICLSRVFPVEGGVYQWVKQGLSPFAGYMAGWCFTVYVVIVNAALGSQLANSLAWTCGAGCSWMADNKPVAVSLLILVSLLAFWVNVRGLHLAKWLSGIGALTTIATFLFVVLALAKGWFSGPPHFSGAFAMSWPGLSIGSLNTFTKMALSALSGFEVCAIASDECRRPGSDVSRSVFLAAPAIALMYILGTAAMLQYVAPRDVDLAAPVAQLAQASFGATGLGRLTASGVAGIAIMALLAQNVIAAAMVSRLPMVAGWDGLLPGWWSELHPRFRTPAKAVGAVTAGLFALGLLSLVGAGNQEAVQVLAAAGIGLYCIMYLLLFSSILFGFRAAPLPRGFTVRIAALSALLVSFAALAFEFVPLGEVGNPGLFALKVGGTICAANGIGVFLYWRGTLRLKRPAGRTS